jgi:hypothetical protein
LSRAGDVADDVLAADRHLPNIFERTHHSARGQVCCRD